MEERSEKLLHYSESDYWVAHYRSMTEGSATRLVHPVGDPRRGLLARGTAFITALFSRGRRGVEEKTGLDGRA